MPPMRSPQLLPPSGTRLQLLAEPPLELAPPRVLPQLLPPTSLLQLVPPRALQFLRLAVWPLRIGWPRMLAEWIPQLLLAEVWPLQLVRPWMLLAVWQLPPMMLLAVWIPQSLWPRMLLVWRLPSRMLLAMWRLHSVPHPRVVGALPQLQQLVPWMLPPRAPRAARQPGRLGPTPR